MNEIHYINDSFFTDVKLNFTGFVILECYKHASEKQIMEPILVKLRNKFHTQINHLRYDAGDGIVVTEVFNIYSFPCYLLFKNGTLCDRMDGFVAFNEFSTKLESCINEKNKSHE